MHLYAYLGVGLAIPHQLWTGADFTSSPGRHGLLVDRVGGVRRQRAGVARRAAGRGATCATTCGSTAVVPEGRRHGLGARHRTRPAPAPGRGRTVLHLALPRTPGLDARATRTRSPPPPTAAVAADHRAGRRRRQRRRSPASTSARACLGRGARTAGSARACPEPRKVAADRRRRGHHPAARARGGTGVRTRRRGAAPPLRPTSRSSPTSSTPWPGSAASSPGASPGRGGHPTPGSGSGIGRPDRPRRPHLLGPRRRRARRLRLRPRRLGRPRASATSAAAGVPDQHLHVESFGW